MNSPYLEKGEDQACGVRQPLFPTFNPFLPLQPTLVGKKMMVKHGGRMDGCVRASGHRGVTSGYKTMEKEGLLNEIAAGERATQHTDANHIATNALAKQQEKCFSVKCFRLAPEEREVRR